MFKNFVVLVSVSLMLVLCAENTLELRIPFVSPIENIVSRLTNTTVGIVRGGIKLFSKTVDRIISTFGRVEDRLRELLEEFRKKLIQGIPELNIPILDPLHINRIDFDVIHESARLKGNAEDVTIQHISKFLIEKENLSDLGNLRFKLDLNLTFPTIEINGDYQLDGILSDSVRVFGDGRFWLNLFDLKLATSSIIKFEYTRLKMVALNIEIKLRKLENNFENLMADEKVGKLFNKAISRMAPEAIDILWPEMKREVEEQILAYINKIFANASIANIIRRLFNIRP